MPDDPLLAEFTGPTPGDLKRRITDRFDGVRADEEEAQIAAVKGELVQILEERIRALGQG